LGRCVGDNRLAVEVVRDGLIFGRRGGCELCFGFVEIGAGAQGMEDGLSDVAEHAGVFRGETMLDESVEDGGHDAADVFGTGKMAGGLGEDGCEGVIGRGNIVRHVVLAETKAGHGRVTAGLAILGFMRAARARGGCGTRRCHLVTPEAGVPPGFLLYEAKAVEWKGDGAKKRTVHRKWRVAGEEWRPKRETDLPQRHEGHREKGQNGRDGWSWGRGMWSGAPDARRRKITI